MTKLTMKKILSVILAVVTVIFCVPVSATGEFTEGLYTYTVSDSNATITGVSSLISGDVIIPDTLGDCPVTHIGDSAFAFCSGLTSIILSDSLTHIGIEAFAGCNSLTSITIPDSVTHIGRGAFNGCENLTNVTFPDKLTSISDYMFRFCDSLTSIILPDSVVYIGDSAFYDCSNLTSITLPDSVTHIGDYAFYDCSNLTSITLPDSVTHIGGSAFYFSGLSTITIPDSVTHIGSYAFTLSDSLVSVTIGSGVSTLPDSIFSNCNSLKKIVIPKSVTSITSDAFYNCPSLSEVYYGGSRMDWDNIAIASTNSCLTSANAIHFNCDTANIDSHFAYTVTTEPTCSTEGTAAYVCPCGFSKYEESLPVTDTHINTEIRDTVTPTASADGYSGDTYCTDCGDMIAKGEIVPKLPVSPGDANGDGAINLADVTLLLQYIAKWDVTLG